MPAYQRLEVTEVGDVTVVRFRSRRITEDIDIQELGSEMFSLVENDKREKLLLNFSTVEFPGQRGVGQVDHAGPKSEGPGRRAETFQYRAEHLRGICHHQAESLF